MTPNTENSQRLIRHQIDYLSGFILPERFEALQTTLALRTRYLTVCLENIFHPQNASAVIRSAEAFGLQDIYAIESFTSFSPNVNIVKGTDKWVDIHKSRRTAQPTLDTINSLRSKGYRIVATTPHQQSCTPETFDVTQGKFALFFGTEHAGISKETLENADEFLKIPMCGFVESLNISVSAAIIIYQLTERVRQQVTHWQLSPTESEEILLRWIKETLKDPEGILQRMPPLP